MKIFLLLSRFDQTGMTTNSLDLFDGLKKYGDVFLAVGKYPSVNDTTVEINKLYEKYSNDDHIVFSPVKRNRNVFSIFKSLIHLIRIILKINPEIIHCESPYYTFVPWLLRLQFLTTMHVTDIYPSFSYKRGV